MAKLTHAGMYTPTELINKYPEVEEKLGWNARAIGFFVSKNIIDGYHKPGTKQRYASEASFLELVRYVNDRMEERKVKIA